MEENVARSARRTRSASPFRTEPHAFGFKPGIDPDRMNRLADELEAEAFRDGYLGRK